MTKKTAKLLTDYQTACNNIVEAFAKKQGMEDWYWIADRVGQVVDFFGQYCFGMEEIIIDLETNQKKGVILNWHDETVDHCLGDENARTINYSSYCKGTRYEHLNKNDDSKRTIKA